MEIESLNICKVIFKLNEETTYTFDVDRKTTFYELKKILSNAAHIRKSGIKIFYGDQEFTDDYNKSSINEIFPTLQTIIFNLFLNKTDDYEENEVEQISVHFNINEPCKIHKGKFLMLYCLTCKKSICSDCYSPLHNNHEVAEKADYLMPSKILMERIFQTSNFYKIDTKYSNYMACLNFRSTMKTEFFDKIRRYIDEFENQCNHCLDFFSVNEDLSEKNNDMNIELLKKYCISSFIRLKNDINTKGIIIDDEVFLALYNKLKAIKVYEHALFSENLNKYKELNSFLFPFTQEIAAMSNELSNIIARFVNKDIYANFRNNVAKNKVELIQKNDILNFMFEGIKIPNQKYGNRVSLSDNKNSRTPNPSQNNFRPQPILFNNKNISFQNNFSLNTIVNSNIPNTTTSKKENNINVNFLSYKETTNNKENKEEKSISDIKSTSLSPVSNNISTLPKLEPKENIEINNKNLNNDFNKITLIEKQKLETVKPKISTSYLSPVQIHEKKTEENENNSRSAIRSNNIDLSKISGELISNTNQNINNHQISFYQKQSTIVTNSENSFPSQIIENTNQTPQKNSVINTNFNQSINNQNNDINLFHGKLVDVLNEQIQNQKNLNTNNSNIENNIKQNITNTKICMSSSNANLKEKENNKAISTLVMYPVFKTNIIKGALDKNNVDEFQIDFSKVFKDKDDVLLTEFPLGGAYCHYKKKLYFSGGQDYIKNSSKVFLSIPLLFNEKDPNNLSKLPNLINPHWNHSMIANENQIYVIGGYNSNKCERFDIINQKWFEMPDLKVKERQRAMLLIDDNYLYAFMGLSQFGLLDSVERINLGNLSNGWEIVTFSNPNGLSLKFYGSGIRKIPDSEKYYFVGGKCEKDSNGNEFHKNIYEISLKEKTINQSEFRVDNDLFFIENNLYDFESKECGNFISLENGFLISMPVLELQ